MIREAAQLYEWNINLSTIALLWSEGCIIKSNLMFSLIDHFKSKSSIFEMEPFIDQINTDKSKMLNTFDKLQAIVVNLKTDMLSLLSIQVDYIDADGD